MAQQQQRRNVLKAQSLQKKKKYPSVTQELTVQLAEQYFAQSESPLGTCVPIHRKEAVDDRPESTQSLVSVERIEPSGLTGELY